MEVEPLLCGWMPVELTKSSGLERDEGSCKGLAGLEVG